MDEVGGEHAIFIGINPILVLEVFSLAPEDALAASEDNYDVLVVIWGLDLVVMPHF
jgi:hypothetical protein